MRLNYNKTLFLLLIFVCISANAQWEYKSGGNAFDGKYKTASIIGKGFELPYTKPKLVINHYDDGSIKFYITDIGYLGCASNFLKVTFNNDDTIYETAYSSTNINNDVLFIKSIDDMTMSDFYNLLKNKSKLYIRHVSACGQNDFEFSLSGSTKAIDFVIGDWLKEQTQQ